MASASDYVMVAAIDFGTTFSGYAFSFRHSVEDIKINKNWGESLGFQSFKTPTTVLTRGENEFVAFGYEAEKDFTDIATEDDSDDDDPEHSSKERKNLYRQFKMVLHKKEKLTMKSPVCSTSGQITPAIEIFTHALRYLQNHLIGEVSKQLKGSIDCSLIRWVITVPAIWTEESKQFMREAAYRSGCITEKDSKQLIVALEPEVASFYCRQLNLVEFENSEDISFKSGTKYLVLDCGGGTNDMVVHEIVLDYKIKEICAVNGGSWGGTKIDERFIALMKELLGDDFIEMFRDKYPQQWLLFITRFETAKKIVKPDGQSKISIDVPWLMIEQYAKVYPEDSLPKAFKRAKAKGVSFKQGILVLSNDAVRALFEETTGNIVQGVRALLDSHTVDRIDYIFMVGGLSENAIVQHVVKEKFGRNGCKVLIPREAQLAVTKGAVLFGHHQDHVVSRVARKTYGSSGRRDFDESIHDPKKRVLDEDGNPKCDDIFICMVNVGDEVALETTKEHIYGMPIKKRTARFPLFSMPRKPNYPIQYTDDPDMTKIGEICVDTSATAGTPNREIALRMTFGSTEILVEAIDKSTGNKYSTAIDFLSD